MRRFFVLLAAFGCLAGMDGSRALAAPFEPLFQVFKVTGDCKVLVPGTTTYVAAEESKAYPYGSRIATGPGASLTILFGKDNECAVSENSNLTVAEDSGDPSRKHIRIVKGKVDVSVEDTYEQSNLLVIVSSCSSVTCTKGGQSSVDVSTEEDLRVVVIQCQNGEISVDGPSYDIPVMKKNDWASVSCSEDRGFVRIKNVKGDFGVAVKDSQAAPRLVVTEPGTVIKILRKPSDTSENMIVTTLEVGPDGTVRQADTYMERVMPGEAVPPPEEPAPPAVKPVKVPKPPRPIADKDKAQWPEIPIPPLEQLGDQLLIEGDSGLPPKPPKEPVVTAVPVTLLPAITLPPDAREPGPGPLPPFALPRIAVSPPDIVFGPVKVGQCDAMSFTVENIGEGILRGSASVPGPHFKIKSGSPYTLSAGETVQVVVEYCPQGTGNHSASVNFTGGGGESTQVMGSGISDVTPTGRR